MTSWKFDIIIFYELTPPPPPTRTRITCYSTEHKRNILVHSTSFLWVSTEVLMKLTTRSWWCAQCSLFDRRGGVGYLGTPSMNYSHNAGTYPGYTCFMLANPFMLDLIVASTELHHKGCVETPLNQVVPHIKMNKK